MRKVNYKRFIPGVLNTDKRGYEPGTDCFEKEFNGVGIFHQWAAATIEGDNGFGNHTVALVELPDGTMLEVASHHLKFDKSSILKYFGLSEDSNVRKPLKILEEDETVVKKRLVELSVKSVIAAGELEDVWFGLDTQEQNELAKLITEFKEKNNHENQD